MPAKIISMTEWKAAHPPALIFFQHGLACAGVAAAVPVDAYAASASLSALRMPSLMLPLPSLAAMARLSASR